MKWAYCVSSMGSRSYPFMLLLVILHGLNVGASLDATRIICDIVVYVYVMWLICEWHMFA